ncbi:lysophospholipid acyltransferase family protein [Alkalicoccus daliensis]|uniref:1-acyl-sn-glycerol-3-phosphate acyltransferase n=1 Tax=Alkalicoccus daliensis TaxID=745820 RepID=A0A1H0B0M6_9BACI|nr:lysophospholipid acyltransferase family protein [Alkalicoccus daliensis]SDN39201.1 1-acyl-sn-glycerol-3-phosphate acyltransferase [Alkalicoccus daliensis]
MIQASDNETFKLIFHNYNKHLIRRNFHGIYLTKNSNPLPAKGSIVLINHSSWWDPLILFYLNQSIWKKNALAMMSEDGLARFPFFKKIGAFSINPNSPRSIVESLDYAAAQLRAGKHIFLFPQGNEFPLDKRPLQFFSGAGHLKYQVPTAPVIPISFYHGLFHHSKPEWFIHIGAPVSGAPSWNRKKWTKQMEDYHTQELNYLREDIIQENDNFVPLLSGYQDISTHWERLKRKAGILK